MRSPITKALIYQTRRELGPLAGPADVARKLGVFRTSVIWHLHRSYVLNWIRMVAKHRRHEEIFQVVKLIRAKGFALGRTPYQREIPINHKAWERYGGMYYLTLLAGMKPTQIGTHRNPRYDGKAPVPDYWNALCARSEIKSWSALKPPPTATV